MADDRPVPPPAPAAREPAPIVGTGTPLPARLHPRTKRRRPLRWLLLGLAAAGAAGIAVALFRTPPLAVELGEVTEGTVQVTVEAEGRTHVQHRHVLVAPAAGVLARITLRAGDRVTDGQPVAELTASASAMLDPRTRDQARERVGAATAALAQAEAAAARARAARDLAARELGRARRLEAAGALSAQDLDQAAFTAAARDEEHASAVAGVEMARHDLASARAALATVTGRAPSGRLEVRAPMTGLVLRILHEDEGVVAPGTPLLEVGDPATLEVQADVLSADAARLAPGAVARVTGWGGPALEARVARIEPTAFTRRSSLGVDEQRVRVVLALQAAPAALVALGDGYRVEAEIEQGTSVRGLVVPAGALVRRGGGWMAYRAEQGRAVAVPVTVGLRNPAAAEVRSGLSKGDRVVLYPPDAIANGSRLVPSRP